MNVQVRMSEEEKECLSRYFNSVRRVVELGCGGSTLLALENIVEKLVSVETDLKWIENLSQDPQIKASILAGRLDLVHVDIGLTVVWGYPKDDSRKQDWLKYCRYMWKVCENGIIPELVFIDGRFRVACVCAASLAVESDFHILIQDFWSRNHYHVVLDFLDWVESAGDLEVFRPKTRFQDSKSRINEIFDRYSLIPH